MANGHRSAAHRLAFGFEPGGGTGPQVVCGVHPGGLPHQFTVTCAEPFQRWEFDLENANLRGHWVGTFAGTAGGTALCFTETVEVKRWWMGPFVRGYLKRQQARYVEDLRRALEKQA